MAQSLVNGSDRQWTRRPEDRRQGVHQLIRCLAEHVVVGDPEVRLHHLLEARLARLLGAARAGIVPARSPAAAGARLASRAQAAIPGPPHAQELALEVDWPGRLPDGWDRQMVETAAHLATLALAADRSRSARAYHRAPTGAAPLIGSSQVMRALRDRIERVATADFTVLIDGESGTGKELVARQIHDLSPRRGGPFVAVNCAALVETLLEAELFGIEERTATGVRGRRGKFEHADGGTLFLDEVADLSLGAQAKLLRAIQEMAVERVGGHGTRRLNVRIVAATNTSLAALVQRGLFRADLYYRLSGLDLRVPPLRHRREDILELAQYFLACHDDRVRMTLSPPAADALAAYDWPGNVRELQRTLEGAVAMADSRVIDLDDLPPALRTPYGEIVMPSIESNDTLRVWASRYARLVLERSGHNKRRACRTLGISYHTLQAHLRYRALAAAAPPVPHGAAAPPETALAPPSHP
jgi:transcriptional regulator with PAS, ATPase and Fis domain